MSDKYLQLAERDVDAKLRKGKLEEGMNTKIPAENKGY